MDGLEFNIHQLILSDLAASVGASKNDPADPTIDSSIEIITSNVTTRAVSQNIEDGADGKADLEQKVYMSASRARCNIGFAELSVNLSVDLLQSTVPVLLDILRDIPYIDFDINLTWDEWSLPDQLVYSTISALLKLATVHSDYRKAITGAISTFTSVLVQQLQDSPPTEVLTHHALSFHGLYRAIISTEFSWNLHDWAAISEHLNILFAPDVIERLNRSLVDAIQAEDGDLDVKNYIQATLSRYVSCGRPLNGYFLVCCVVEAQWTMLAQTLYPSHIPIYPVTGEEAEAAAANKAWSTLMREVALEGGALAPALQNAVKKSLELSMQTFTDLLVQIEEMDSEPSLDTYAWETMSESLKLGTVCAVALRDLDNSLFSRLKVILSVDSPIADGLVQVAALKAVTVLVQHFPDMAASLVVHLRRFVMSPLPAFENEYVSETRIPTALYSAAKCLSLCIKLAPGDDLIMSNMYSLLNHIAATSKEMHDTLHNAQLNGLFSASNSERTTTHSDRATLHSVETGAYGYTEDERRLITISTISVVSRLALEFKRDDATKLTIAMLIQRLRISEPYAEAAIAHNLVDLALKAPESSFQDIIRAFSSLSLSVYSEDPRFSNNMILAAQTRLAQELHQRSEFYHIYLHELLTLFGDKGVAIQNASVQNKYMKAEDLAEQLVSLLLPIDALLSHANFNPHLGSSSETVALFRNMWFLCTLFHFTRPDEKDGSATEWRRPALSRIAAKTPALVSEDAHDTLVSDIEFNSSIRIGYAHSVMSKHRTLLSKYLPYRSTEIRSITPGEAVLLLAMHDVETMRAAAGLPSSLASYFMNNSVNSRTELSACMDSMADKVMTDAVQELSYQARTQSLPEELLGELQVLLTGSTHRVAKARTVASKYLNKLITSFPSLMCDPTLVFSILEVLTLLRRSCEGEYVDEYNPTYEFHSERVGITLQLPEDYKIRDEILVNLQRNSSKWFELGLSRAPMELQSTLQKYLAVNQSLSPVDSIDLGASIAETFGKAIGPVERKLSSLASLSKHKPDRAKVVTSQIASKAYFLGEIAGLRLAARGGKNLQKAPDKQDPVPEIAALREKMHSALAAVREKRNSFTIQDLKRLLFRCASSLISVTKCDYTLMYYMVALPFEVFTPSAMAAGIETWTWVISERHEFEIAMMAEINTAWMTSIRLERGIFSKSLNYNDPFFHPVDYAPTDKEVIDRATNHARRLLSPHTLILQMLFSRLQAAKYRKPGLMLLIQRLVLRSARAYRNLSTHPLAREARFSFLIFGFEALGSSRLDSYCEYALRDSLYTAAFAWFAVRPQWSHGSNRLQMDADSKLLKEFLSCLQADTARLAHEISSLGQARASMMNSTYVQRLKSHSVPLKLLVENELYRLSVWANLINDPKRGADHPGNLERTMTEDSWKRAVRAAWETDPGIAVSLVERFKHPVVTREVSVLVRSRPREVLHVPEAVEFLVGDRLDGVRRDLRYLLFWDPVPPVIAVTFFEPRYHSDSLILQYAHRVLAQHPVELTFFFVPQIVQALRYDELGYVTKFVFETAKISQLFCHQIIWNMKANCFKDDAAEVEDPMKPVLDRMILGIVESLSGPEKDFYDREFTFFGEVTSISGKLKPYIKKSKPEKKAKIDEEMAKIQIDPGVYLPSNPDGKVIDIDKKSGRPLQSHAKAPFMATFKVRKQLVVINADPDSLITGDGGEEEHRAERDVWIQAIFKVGDDCRQDVLALQVIAMFKNIFTGVGLTLYLYPYRVTATAPGCGVIDVVPNATSRDEMGRAKVNDLQGFFISKYGGEDSVAFQKARLNFIQSMAAYSVACYILQIKDRHNGNIMIDGEGHIVHIDFGFLFDIGPGGVKFEPNSFKLNHEMVVLMGGRASQGYTLFQQLCVAAFLALRPHAPQLIATVQLMLDTGLPSFKGEGTIRRLRDRFALGLNERQAADFMMSVVRNAHENVRSTAYDEFQRLQNGIPYK
ncbi:atypical/PIKK/PI4K protein kinase [Gloeopeniophorella convolvens]|nr:atypical/PIKK/PI4K protein kinase [Gloeopeniophorella convolvens]